MNKPRIFTLLVIALAVAVSILLIMETAKTDYESAKPTTISVDKTEIDMGTLQQGKPQTVTFKLTNNCVTC